NLEVHPELRGGLEQAREPEGSVSGNAPLPPDHLIEPVQRDIHAASRFHLAHSQRFEEFLKQNLARRRRCSRSSRSHGSLLFINFFMIFADYPTRFPLKYQSAP